MKEMEETWNEPEKRHPLFKDFKHPINFNFGTITGGEWPSSVPCASTFQMRVGFFPGEPIENVKSAIENCIKTAAEARNIPYSIEYNGFHAEGCEMDMDSPLFSVLGDIHKKVTQDEPKYGPVTCTTDARFFQLYSKMPATCYGPESKSIHGIDESVSIESMMRVARVLCVFMSRWCGLEAL